MTSLTLTGVVLDTPDPDRLASFYERLLGWKRDQNESTWVTLTAPNGGAGLSFQYEPVYRRPRWPSTPEEQQMSVHLDIQVDDLDAAGAIAREAGATLADFQPQERVRVWLDPDGHPFCLYLP
jgi:catechol 2,3-dioxygenase-like lactoylglutathione lyase family enzyme